MTPDELIALIPSVKTTTDAIVTDATKLKAEIARAKPRTAVARPLIASVLTKVTELKTVFDAVEIVAPPPPEPPPDPPPAPPDTETVVTNAAELVAALNDAAGVAVRPIRLKPGPYVGNFTVSFPGTRLLGVDVAPDTRVSPEQVSAVRLSPADPQKSVIIVKANDVLISGVLIDASNKTTVWIGTDLATTVEAQPYRVTLRGVAIVGSPSGVNQRGVEMHGTDLAVLDSHIEGIKTFAGGSQEAQAIWSHNGPGPYRIVNNYLEGSTENVMFGGGGKGIEGVIPSDILIARNLFRKPLTWKPDADPATPTPFVKNLLEFKNALRVVVEDNEFDGNWAQGQDGTPLMLTPRNQDGRMPWVQVADITIRRNVFRNVRQGHLIGILGIDNNFPTLPTTNITIEHNYAPDASSFLVVEKGMSGTLIVRNNTVPGVSQRLMKWIGGTAAGVPRFTFSGNVGLSGQYNVYGEGITVASVPAVLSAFTVLEDWSGNVIEKSPIRSVTWPSGTTILQPGELAGRLGPDGKYLPGGAGF